MKLRFLSVAVAFPLLAGAQSVPDLATLLKDARANQKKAEAIRENYTFRHIQTTENLDSGGKVVSTESAEREVFFVNGRRIGRLIRKDGRELTEAERKAEDARVRKIVEEEMRRGPAQRQGRRDPGIRLSQIVDLAKISNPRRVSYRGRDTFAFDFTGDPRAHAQGMEQNAAKKMSGAVWIDAAERQVARLEVRFDDNFRIGGGLVASVQKGTSFVFEQSPMGDGLWMETASEQHVAARVVVKSYRQNVHSKDVDFRKFDVGTLQNIMPPAR